MIPITEVDRHFDVKSLRRIVQTGTDRSGVRATVEKIIVAVQQNGDSALRSFTRKFDKARISSFKVSHQEIVNSLHNIDPRGIDVIRKAAENIRRFHRRQMPASWKIKGKNGSELQQIILPIEKVGLYVPGGKAAYPSTVLMNAIPAQVAGVKEIHLVSPPDKDGNIHPLVLATAAILGISNVYRVGGAQAIAALAVGTESIPRVDKIVGPGNIYVATAKRQVYGMVGIDSFAGPSEVVILADRTAHASYIAADLLAQAEHDELASSILITDDLSLAKRVQSELSKLSYVLPRKDILRKSLRNHGAIYAVRNLASGIAIVNDLAPEHLEIITHNPDRVLRQIKHAGSIFLGNYSPVALGDYFAGPNHVLPTSGTARFSSPLGVEDFIKRSSVTSYSRTQLKKIIDDVAFFATLEGLTAHAFSLGVRRKD